MAPHDTSPEQLPQRTPEAMSHDIARQRLSEIGESVDNLTPHHLKDVKDRLEQLPEEQEAIRKMPPTEGVTPRQETLPHRKNNIGGEE